MNIITDVYRSFCNRKDIWRSIDRLNSILKLRPQSDTVFCNCLAQVSDRHRIRFLFLYGVAIEDH